MPFPNNIFDAWFCQQACHFFSGSKCPCVYFDLDVSELHISLPDLGVKVGLALHSF